MEIMIRRELKVPSMVDIKRPTEKCLVDDHYFADCEGIHCDECVLRKDNLYEYLKQQREDK